MNIYIDNNLTIAKHFFATPKYNPFIAISLGSRPPSLEKAIRILKWALQSNVKTIPILFADEIAHINYRALGYSSGKALRQVSLAKENQVITWQTAINHLSDSDKLIFKLTNWSEIVSPEFVQQQDIIRKEFSDNKELYNLVLWLVEGFLKSSGKTITSKRCIDMAEYIIQELPLLLFGIELNCIHYQMMLYPTHYSSEMISMIAKIRRKSEFKTLINKLLSIHPLEFNKIIQIIVSEKTPLSI